MWRGSRGGGRTLAGTTPAPPPQMRHVPPYRARDREARRWRSGVSSSPFRDSGAVAGLDEQEEEEGPAEQAGEDADGKEGQAGAADFSRCGVSAGEQCG